jgi:hypothetical protein
VAAFLWNVVHSILLKHGERRRDDPWGSDTLDWALGAPSPNEGYRVIPIVRSRYPMWEQERLDVGSPREERIVHGLAERPATWRAALVTSPVDAEPAAITWMSTPSWWPFAFAVVLTVLFAETLFDRLELIALGTRVYTVAGLILLALCLRESERRLRRAER